MGSVAFGNALVRNCKEGWLAGLKSLPPILNNRPGEGESLLVDFLDRNRIVQTGVWRLPGRSSTGHKEKSGKGLTDGPATGRLRRDGGWRITDSQHLPALLREFRIMRLLTCFAVSALILVTTVRADGPRDNIPADVRRVPALGIDVPEADRKELEAGLESLGRTILELEGRSKKDARTAELLPDVRIYWKAVHDALTYREFFNIREIPKAKVLLKEGQGRAESLLNGQAPWTTQTGLVVRGYVSKIDGSVQPYGLVIPPSYTEKTAGKYRLDIWFHGRGETLSEVNFLDEHRTRAGEFTPPDTIVLHPYGRFCNAAKFAGEVDALEALDSVSKRYRVHESFVSVRGFSMGGASVWQFAVHYPDRWFAANPGAGFAETPLFLKVFQSEKLTPTWYEQKLWNMYDCDKWAANLRQLPVVAYSGELDSQKQAADVMAGALAKENIELTHIIGPKTKHAYTPDGRREVDRRLASLSASPRERAPSALSLVTYTLKYNRMYWLTIDGIGEHWMRARVEASIGGGPDQIVLKTSNVTALTIDFPPGTTTFEPKEGGVTVLLDQTRIDGPRVTSDRSWRSHWIKEGNAWKQASAPPVGLVKRHDLQGPIDDAFMNSFIIIRPTGKARSEKFAAWSRAEMDRAIEHWRRHFRGMARVKDDTAVTDADIASANLILWGDSESNAVLKRIADKLPIGWRGDKVVVGDRSFPAADHAPIAIYPNPLNPDRYVVLNSGFTFRDYDYLNNARQVPKLPDWAIVDLNTPPDSRYPGKVVAADFFGEHWEVKPPRPD
jgi:pimeloyl-ACP methyl ester carboxylesterase